MAKPLSLIKVSATSDFLQLAKLQIPKLNVKIRNIWLDSETCEIILLENCFFTKKNEALTGDKLTDFYLCPDLYWLSSKKLARQISNLENYGTIKELQAKLTEDKFFLHTYRISQEDFKLRRKMRLAFDDLILIEEFNLHKKFINSGVGAVKTDLHLKCLHAHYAHYLASNGNNAIGRLLVENYGLPSCMHIF